MGIGIITNFNVNASKNIDARLGPYATVDEATGSIDPLYRYIGMTVTITGSQTPIDYWFNPTIANTDLVLKSGGGVSGGTINYLAVWSGSTSLTTGSIYDSFGGKIGIGKSDPTYALDVSGDFRVIGSNSLIIQRNNKHGIINPIEITSGSTNQLLEFIYDPQTSNTYYQTIFFDYRIDLLDISQRPSQADKLIASRCGTLKNCIYAYDASSGGPYAVKFQTTDNSTAEYQREYTVGTEDITLSFSNSSGNIYLLCSNNVDNSNYIAAITGEYKLISVV